MDYKFTVALPEIYAVSEKQRAYADDLRSDYIASIVAAANSRLAKAFKAARGDEAKVNAAMKQQGFENAQDFVNKYVLHDKKIQFYMTETSARKIIDTM